MDNELNSIEKGIMWNIDDCNSYNDGLVVGSNIGATSFVFQTDKGNIVINGETGEVTVPEGISDASRIIYEGIKQYIKR